MRLVEADQAVGQVVNVGSDETTTIEGLAQLVKSRTGSGSEIQLIPYDEAYEPGFEDMIRRTPNLEKLVRFDRLPPLPAIARDCGPRRLAHAARDRDRGSLRGRSDEGRQKNLAERGGFEPPVEL